VDPTGQVVEWIRCENRERNEGHQQESAECREKSARSGSTAPSARLSSRAEGGDFIAKGHQLATEIG
jgi:hypothetical protein